MNFKRFLNTLVGLTLGVFMSTGHSAFDPVNEDTDIFLSNPSFPASRPNILIILDNTANWNVPFTAEKNALVSAIDALDDRFNVGLMMFTEPGGGNPGDNGAYVRFAVRQMTVTNKGALKSIINGLDNANDRATAGKTGLAMYEALLYYGGATAYAGSLKAKRDYAAGANTLTNPVATLPGNAFTSAASTTYVSPITDGCQKNFIVYISNGKGQEPAADLTFSENKLKALNGGTYPSIISLNPNSQQANWADEWAGYMATSDCHTSIPGTQKVSSYTLDVGPSDVIDASNEGVGWSRLLQSMGLHGKGNYFRIANNATDTTSQIANALKTIFTEVQAVNSVFASTTLPVSVNVRGTNLNQVYIGVFRPDANKSPRWLGNLKLYKLGVANGKVFLADALGVEAENSDTGFISNTATSFWTEESCFWQYRAANPNGAPPATGTTCATLTSTTPYKYWSDKPDGDVVEKAARRSGLERNTRPRRPAARSTPAPPWARLPTAPYAARPPRCRPPLSTTPTPISPPPTSAPSRLTASPPSPMRAPPPPCNSRVPRRTGQPARISLPTA